jgi:hypothetical protein
LAIDKTRKWEVSSALQKVIRRGDQRVALRIVSAVASLGEWRYFWRRLPVIVTEDVGLADAELVAFVIASAVSHPNEGSSENYDAFAFLVSEMCALQNRTRVGCSLSIIESAWKSGTLPELNQEEKEIVGWIVEVNQQLKSDTSLYAAWARRNGWRTEGMLKFTAFGLPFPLEPVTTPVPPAQTLYELPSYAFDLHCRVGLRMLKKLSCRVKGAEAIQQFVIEHKLKRGHRVVGEGLFCEEGCRINGELFYEPLATFEQRVIAAQSGLTLKSWLDLRNLIEEALRSGLINRVRKETLTEFYGQTSFNFAGAVSVA